MNESQTSLDLNNYVLLGSIKSLTYSLLSNSLINDTSTLKQDSSFTGKVSSFVHDISLHNLHDYFKTATKNYFENFKNVNLPLKF